MTEEGEGVFYRFNKEQEELHEKRKTHTLIEKTICKVAESLIKVTTIRGFELVPAMFNILRMDGYTPIIKTLIFMLLNCI